jgi:hypothetical protein
MKKEADVVYFQVPYRNFPGRVEESYEKNLRMIGILADIRTTHLPSEPKWSARMTDLKFSRW